MLKLLTGLVAAIAGAIAGHHLAEQQWPTWCPHCRDQGYYLWAGEGGVMVVKRCGCQLGQVPNGAEDPTLGRTTIPCVWAGEDRNGDGDLRIAGSPRG